MARSPRLNFSDFSTAFSSGKIILFGEHSVVYGYPALCGALEKGITVKAVPGTGRLTIPQLQKSTDLAADLLTNATTTDSLSLAYLTILREFFPDGVELDVDFVVSSDIPFGAGLGSSAALCVALCRLFYRVKNIQISTLDEAQRILTTARAAECAFHGRSSGLDPSISFMGGAGLFQKDLGLSPLSLPPLSLCIGMSGQPRNTLQQVQRVAERLLSHPEETRRAFVGISESLATGLTAWANHDWVTLGSMLDENHQVLKSIGVSSAILDAMCESALESGALGAKLTGAGGGGCVLAFAPRNEQAVMRNWKNLGFDSFLVEISRPR